MADEKETVTLREYLDTRISNVEKNTAIAAASMEKRLEAMNEFRQALNDQKTSFITRAELKATIDKLDADIETLKLSKATLEGKATQGSVYIALVFALIGVVIGVVSLFR